MINRTNLLIDFGILSAFLVVMEPGLTGLAVHEWLGVAFFATILLHLLLHWRWVASMTAQFFKKLFHNSRLQYVVDAILMISFTAAMLSGLMISRVVVPLLNLNLLGENFAWRSLHAASATSTLLMIGLHFALHWDWVVSMTRRYLIRPVITLIPRRTPDMGQTAAVPVEIKDR
ncbi:MAG TPA: DUF4405 domain-containing protein [Anaerolineaceae bacterium]